MKEIPMYLIKGNQIGIVTFVLLAIVFQQPVLIWVLWLIQIISFLSSSKANVFIWITKLVVGNPLANGGEQQAVELARFNQTIAVVLLTVSSVLLLLSWHVSGYIFAALVGVAALAAVAGYCIGCTFYYQYKKWKSAH